MNGALLLAAIGLLLICGWQHRELRDYRRKETALDWAKRELQPLGKRR